MSHDQDRVVLGRWLGRPEIIGLSAFVSVHESIHISKTISNPKIGYCNREKRMTGATMVQRKSIWSSCSGISVLEVMGYFRSNEIKT